MQTLLTLSQKVFKKELDHKCKESQPIDLIYIFNVMHSEEWYGIKYRSKCKRALRVRKNKNYRWQENGVYEQFSYFFLGYT